MIDRNRLITKCGPSGLLAKVKVLDTGSGLCFETDIRPEEITTDTGVGVGMYCGLSRTTMSFSPITVPDIKDWKAEWDDRYAKLRGRRGVSYMIDDLRVKKIIFSGPCTIVLWDDGTKTMARVSEGDTFDPEKGVAICFMKKIMGHTETNKILRGAEKQYHEQLRTKFQPTFEIPSDSVTRAELRLNDALMQAADMISKVKETK